MAKQQPPIVSSDDADGIIDLTDIVQKGKAPLASKPDVDFDSALSDLMGKGPSMKMNDTPELEALLSGIEEGAPKRRPEFREDEEEGPMELQDAVPGADDMDSLLTTLESKKGKATQPAEDVDSLLDSLMDDLGPAGSGNESPDQNISDADLDDLLSSIDQDSKQTGPKVAEPPSDLDDLLAGLEMPKAAPKDEVKAPNDLDELLAGLNAPAQTAAQKAPEKTVQKAPEKAAAKEAAPEPPSDLDDLLAELNVAKPAKKDTKKAQDDLDKLLAGMNFSSPASEAGEMADTAEPKAERKAEPKAEAKPVDSIDDLLAGLDNLTKPKAEPKAEPKAAPQADETAAPNDLDDLLAGLDGLKSGGAPEESAPEAEDAAKAPDVRGIPDSDLDDLLAGLEAAVKPAAAPAKTATPAPTKAEDAKVDFGDLAAMLDTPEASSSAADSAVGDDSLADFMNSVTGVDDIPDAPEAADFVEAADSVDSADSPDGPVDFSKPSFDAKDFDDLDALFAGKTPEQPQAVTEPMATPAATSVTAPVAEPAATSVTAPATTPLAELVAQAAATDARMGGKLPELTARVERVESELSALQARVATLENQPAPEPQQEQLAAMLVDGTPLCNRLMELMRSAIAQELKALSTETENSSHAIAALENRAVSMEGKLAEVAIMAAKAVAGPENPEPGLTEAALTPLNERLDKLEGNVVRQEELDVLSERLDGLEEQAALAGQAAPTPETSAADVSAEALAKLEQRLAALESRPYVPLETIQGAFDQMGEQLNVPLQQFQNRITALEQRLADEALPRLAGDLVPFMSESIDKAAAASAAQALREELEAMMSETDDTEDADDLGGADDLGDAESEEAEASGEPTATPDEPVGMDLAAPPAGDEAAEK